MKFKVTPGFEEGHRRQMAQLFWGAFEGKLHSALGRDARALQFLDAALQPKFAFSAVREDGRLLGGAGIKTDAGGLLVAKRADLSAVYGFWGSIWRGAILELFERPLKPGTLQMDGIFVAADARGQGVGTALLDAVVWTAKMNRCQTVTLDVVNGNSRAQALYERYGFVAAGRQNVGLLSPVLGFRSATKMNLAISA